ncbi:cyclic nucleotide-binding domain-containing protein [candidate division KSB3 bacterium]|uniref:Cyclic nucleotide-binding domain-containing protein n=1 Tax=candidate division KSB3 bacterium TaxID=2044937 RepID=A0A9D5Q659_9BACT|nr:cyclic nucleotide-binding domain-containing protein [candidate division KSB3 bacterium]MBD3324571.1 cyclic nucleotide-binding domain-containing protein [candidate division KSB3 bacterium]
MAQDLQADIEKYQRRIAERPQLSEQTIPMHLTLGKLYERAGNKTEASQEFAKVALFYADHGNIIKAMAAAQLLVRLDPDNEEILDRLGELYFQRKTVSDDQLQDYHESIKHIEALHVDPKASAAQEEARPDAPTGDDAAEVIASLKQVPLLAKLSVSELRGIYANAILHHCAANEPILSAGNTQRALFVILQGSVKVFGKDKDQRSTLLATLKAGTSFGEFALFGKIDSRLSVIAEQASTVLEIPRDIVLKLAKNRPALTDTLKTLFRQRILDTALARVPLFSQLNPQDRQKIISHFSPIKAKAGTTLVREAEPGDSMYFLLAGKVGVYTSLDEAEEESGSDGKDEALLLATLKNGDFFGEQALVTNEPRSATVTALTDVTLLKLSKSDLETVMTDHPWIESTLQIEAYQNLMNKKLSILDQLATPADG